MPRVSRGSGPNEKARRVWQGSAGEEGRSLDKRRWVQELQQVVGSTGRLPENRGDEPAAEEACPCEGPCVLVMGASPCPDSPGSRRS